MKPLSADANDLKRWLAAMGRRRRLWALFSGIARALLVCSGVAVLLVAGDRWFVLSRAIRIGFFGIIALIAVVAIVKALAAAVRSVDLITSAGHIEQFRPTLDERLLTLSSLPIRADSLIGNRLFEQVVRVLKAEPLSVAWNVRQSIMLAVGAVSLTGLLLLASYRPAWATAEERVFKPWGPTPAASGGKLSLTAGSTPLTQRDSTFALSARVTGSSNDETVVLHVIDSTGETSIVMTPQGQNRFTRTLGRLLQSVDVYATTAELRSKTVHISIGSKPATRPKRAT